MYVAYDIRQPICDCEFFPPFSIFCKHTSKFTCHPIFWVPDPKNRCRKLGVGCRKSDSDTCKQPKINVKKARNRCRKSAVGCRKPHTCVRSLRHVMACVCTEMHNIYPHFYNIL